MLTTKDNPFDPYKEYVKWSIWDRDNGYNTENYLARLLQHCKLIDEEYSQEDVDSAMQSVLENDIIGVYQIV